MPSFEDELVALFKKHGITTTSMLCYNDPDEVAKYNEELRVYNEQLDSWNTKYNEWVKTNPEPKGPKRYVGWTSRINSKELSIYDAWETKLEAEIGFTPEKPYPDLFNEEYGDEYVPGIWYSSRC
jgi:hypothetical protein